MSIESGQDLHEGQKSPATDVVVICSSERVAEALFLRMRPRRRRHFGLYRGMSGTLAGRAAQIAIADDGEESVYVAVRQMVPLFAPRLVVYLGEAIAVAEDLRAGDVALVRKAVRCYCPIVITDNMFPSPSCPGEADDLAFPDEETRQGVLTAPAVHSEPDVLSRALAILNPVVAPGAVQGSVVAVRAGTGVSRPGTWRSGEFLRSRFEIDLADGGVYGALLAAADTSVPALALALVRAGRSEEVEREFRRQEERYLNAAAEMVHGVVAALL